MRERHTHVFVFRLEFILKKDTSFSRPIIMEISYVPPTFAPPPLSSSLSLYRTQFFSLLGVCFFSGSEEIRDGRAGKTNKRVFFFFF